MAITRILKKVESIVDSAKYRGGSLYCSVADSIGDATDYSSAKLQVAQTSVAGTYYAIKYAGLSIALVSAPIPTFVAIAVLSLMELSVDSVKGDIERELREKRKQREFGRSVKTLREYGRIPRRSLVETKFLRMEIDAVSGVVSGTLLSGALSGVKLAELDKHQLADLLEASPDQRTKSLLEAYISYHGKTNA